MQSTYSLPHRWSVSCCRMRACHPFALIFTGFPLWSVPETWVSSFRCVLCNASTHNCVKGPRNVRAVPGNAETAFPMHHFTLAERDRWIDNNCQVTIMQVAQEVDVGTCKRHGCDLCATCIAKPSFRLHHIVVYLKDEHLCVLLWNSSTLCMCMLTCLVTPICGAAIPHPLCSRMVFTRTSTMLSSSFEPSSLLSTRAHAVRSTG